MIGLHLARALSLARRNALPIFASEQGGRNRRRDDVEEAWWYYPPSPAVMAEADRVLDLAGLAILFLDETITRAGAVRSRWWVVHLESGEGHVVRWTAPPFADAETTTHAVLGTVRHAERAIRLLVLGLPVTRQVRPGERVEGGVVRSVPRVLEREDAAMPAWSEPAGRCPHDPPGRDDCEPPEPEPEPALAAEADAAARGEVRDPVNVVALFKACTRFRAERTGDLYALAGVAGRLDEAKRRQLAAYLRAEGFAC